MGKKVLLIDDDPNILNLLCNFLSMKGFEIEKAENGYFALKKIEAFKPDVILMDIMMPRIDGFELCEKIREMPDSALSRIPIIIISALNHLSDVKKALTSGANDYLVKPINLGNLLEKISRYIHFDLVVKKESLEDNMITIEKLDNGFVLSIQGEIDKKTLDLFQRNLKNLKPTEFLILFFQNLKNIDTILPLVLEDFISLFSSFKNRKKVVASEQKEFYSLIQHSCLIKKLPLYNTLMEAYEGVKKL